MPCPTETYCGISPIVFDCLKKRAESQGINMPEGSTGVVTPQGITTMFDWNEDSQILTVTIAELPQSDTCDSISKIIRANVISCGGQDC